MNKKVDFSKVEDLQKQKYFDCKVDLVPASLKETYSDLVSKNPVLVSRELIVDGRPFIGIEYAPDGEVASVYTTDAKGKRVNFENAAEQTASNTAPDLIAQRLAEAQIAMHQNKPAVEIEQPKPEKKRVVPRTLDTKLRTTKDSQRA